MLQAGRRVECVERMRQRFSSHHLSSHTDAFEEDCVLSPLYVYFYLPVPPPQRLSERLLFLPLSLISRLPLSNTFPPWYLRLYRIYSAVRFHPGSFSDSYEQKQAEENVRRENQMNSSCVSPTQYQFPFNIDSSLKAHCLRWIIEWCEWAQYHRVVHAWHWGQCNQ